jgi:hypothetical protein
MPVNWYAALVVIVLVGLASVAFARYNYAKGQSSIAPTVGQTYHAALSFDICGTVEAALPATASGSANGLTTTGSGVLLIAPKSSSESGNNATLGKFAKENATGVITNTSIQYPAGVLYKNGAKCAKGTPDAGMTGVVRARSWTLASKKGKKNELFQVGGTYTKQPASLKFKNSQLITVGFGPASKALPKVPSATEVALLQVISGSTAPVATTTTTTAPATAPTTTTTTAGSSTTTTTAGATTTTTKPSTTTTTAKSSG